MSSWLQIVLICIALILLCRILGFVLRKFEIGSAIISIASKYIMILVIVGTVANTLGFGYLSWLQYAVILIFLKLPITTSFQTVYQVLGMIVPYFRCKFRLPSKENYIAKENYILPFTGKWTVVNGGLTKKLSHSWSLLPQRYAYDFIIIDDEGKSFSGDKRSVNSYYCYGIDVVAPANGVVVGLYDRYKDTFVDGKNAYCDSSHIAGNNIIIKHNDSEYSGIAHLMPGSVNVKKGDIVKQGEVIAKCGNSGNSSEPHIHFQLQSGKSFFLSAGLPIAFSDIKSRKKENYSMFDKRPCDDNLQVEGNKSYIGRGLEVENKPGAGTRI